MASKAKSTEFDTDELLALIKLDLSKGNIETALLKAKQILAGDNPPTEAYSVAAKLYAQLRLFERAQQLFKTFLAAEPNAALETFQLGMSYFDDGKRKQAIEVWQGILSKQATHPPALFYTALASAQEGDTATAKKLLDSLIKSIATDNLYFNQAKDLLGAIERGEKARAPASKQKDGGGNFLLNSAYSTEH